MDDVLGQEKIETQPKFCEVQASTFHHKLDEQQFFIGMKIAHVWSLYVIHDFTFAF
jgi:hypothetical protein